MSGESSHGSKMCGESSHGSKMSGESSHGSKMSGESSHGSKMSGESSHGPRFPNGQPPWPSESELPHSSLKEHDQIDLDSIHEQNKGESSGGLEDPPVNQIERDLDELTFSGAAINDLEVQLIHTKESYQQVLVEGRRRVNMLRKKLYAHIVKTEPFIEMWRKAKQVQEVSNKAAARYDKANSQHMAAKEMIRVAESQLAACRAQHLVSEEPSSPSPLDLAWQEMLNHATDKVVVTEKERRDSEIEHKRVLEECRKVMEQYQSIERKLRSSIIKSRPYYQERYRVNQQLVQIRTKIANLDQKIIETKKSYSASLKRLEVLNTEMHQRRGTISDSRKSTLDPRIISSAGNTPDATRRRERVRAPEGAENLDTLSIDSLQIVDAGQFSGSTSSLPSIETNSECSSTPDPDLTIGSAQLDSMASPPTSYSFSNSSPNIDKRSLTDQENIDDLASQLAVSCLTSAVGELGLEGRPSDNTLD